MKKSQLLGFLLTLLFGPLGLFYSSVGSAIVFILLALVIVPLTGGIAAVPFWVVSVLWGFVCVSSYNSQVAKHESKVVKMAQKAMQEETSPVKNSLFNKKENVFNDGETISKTAFIGIIVAAFLVLIIAVAIKTNLQNTSTEQAPIKELADSIPKKP